MAAQKGSGNLLKGRAYFHYELKDTNEVLKEIGQMYAASVYSTAQTTKAGGKPLSAFEEEIFESDGLEQQGKSSRVGSRNSRDVDSQQSDQNSEKESHMQVTPKARRASEQDQKLEEGGKIEDRSIEVMINPGQDKLDRGIWNTLDKASTHKNPKGSQQMKYRNTSSEVQRLKRGLSYISLKVKEIVNRRKRLTYKEVSDEVLEDVATAMTLHEKQSEKETRNVRRRVYDALNVMVSVGILAKDQRCVIPTNKTNFQGRKLSPKWEELTEKQKKFKQLLQCCESKRATLLMLISHYESVGALRKRNQQLKNQTQDPKFYFPLIFVAPSNPQQKNNIVQIESSQQQNVKSIKITGHHIQMFTDSNATKFLNLQPFLEHYLDEDEGELLSEGSKASKDVTVKAVQIVRNNLYLDLLKPKEELVVQQYKREGVALLEKEVYSQDDFHLAD